LRIWAEDFGSEKVMEKSECFLYCDFFITHLWDERFAQIPKGEFLDMPIKKAALSLAEPPSQTWERGSVDPKTEDLFWYDETGLQNSKP